MVKLLCSCKHEFQDERYGKYMRLHNTVVKPSGTEARCTVCGGRKTIKKKVVETTPEEKAVVKSADKSSKKSKSK